MTDAQRRFMHARDNIEGSFLNPIREFLDATSELIKDYPPRIEELTRRAEKAEITLAVIQAATQTALSEIYTFLGVKDHAAAMRTLHDAFPEFAR